MGFRSLFGVASMLVLQVLIICVMGAFMATGRCNLLPADTRKVLNKIVFIAFTPSPIFTSLTKTVTLQDIISRWFMPIDVGISFFAGGVLGLLLVKVLKPLTHLEGLIIATCSTGPFGNWSACRSAGLSLASFPMALGGFYIWTYTCQLIQTSSSKYKELQAAKDASKAPNIHQNACLESHLLKERDGEQRTVVSVQWTKASEGGETQAVRLILFFKVIEPLQHVLDELISPPTLAANLIIGEDAPLHVIQDTIQLLGSLIDCFACTGLRSSRIRPWAIAGVICVHYVILPVIGIGVMKAASKLDFLASDPWYHYVLMVHFVKFAGTVTQLFDVGQEECSVLFLWTYLFAFIVLTIWSTVYMWILS
ncbi:hypothetical protein ACJRO7_005470 [Eucalyptus globulus]|uniref:Uncharacterized protein n=1 Tax=Eucalyptus globulus TaxID=34317 RepID=A0ABD3J7F9_EUCGL